MTVKSNKHRVFLFVIIGLFLCAGLHSVFHHPYRFSPLAKSILYKATTTAVAPAVTKQKKDKPILLAVLMQWPAMRYLSASSATVHERGHRFFSENLHPLSNRAPPALS